MGNAAALAEQPVRRLLVVGNETVAGPEVEEAIRFCAAAGPVSVLVVCPGRTAGADERVDRALARLAAAGIEARGAVGDDEPVRAMEDALRFFRADEIVISTRPYGSSRWLDGDVVGRAWERFRLPLLHVVGEEPQAM